MVLVWLRLLVYSKRQGVVMFSHILWSSLSGDWSTPDELMATLDNEFHFTLDPCPLNAEFDGLDITWDGVVFVNPPYGRTILTNWVSKGYESALYDGATVVMLLPSRTNTQWWHDYVMKGEIRFIKGRLKFGGAINSAPFPSVVVIFSPTILKAVGRSDV